MAQEAWVVLYSKHLTQKKKKWLDGYLLVNALTKEAALYDDEGCSIQTSRLSKSFVLESSARITSFDGLLVELQDPCSPQNIPSRGSKDACTATKCETTTQDQQQQQQQRALNSAWTRPAAALVQQTGHEGPLVACKPLKASAAWVLPQAKPQAQPRHMQHHTRVGSSTCHPNTVSGTAVRSDDEILSMLGLSPVQQITDQKSAGTGDHLNIRLHPAQNESLPLQPIPIISSNVTSYHVTSIQSAYIKQHALLAGTTSADVRHSNNGWSKHIADSNASMGTQVQASSLNMHWGHLHGPRQLGSQLLGKSGVPKPGQDLHCMLLDHGQPTEFLQQPKQLPHQHNQRQLQHSEDCVVPPAAAKKVCDQAALPCSDDLKWLSKEAAHPVGDVVHDFQAPLSQVKHKGLIPSAPTCNWPEFPSEQLRAGSHVTAPPQHQLRDLAQAGPSEQANLPTISAWHARQPCPSSALVMPDAEPCSNCISAWQRGSRQSWTDQPGQPGMRTESCASSPQHSTGGVKSMWSADTDAQARSNAWSKQSRARAAFKAPGMAASNKPVVPLSKQASGLAWTAPEGSSTGAPHHSSSSSDATSAAAVALRGLSFPPANTAAGPQRRCCIPTQFESVQQYAGCMTAALVEEVNLRMLEVAQPFHAAAQRLSQQQQQQQQQQNGMPSSWKDKGLTGGQQQGPMQTATQLETLCVQSHVPYFAQCDLTMWRAYNKQGSGSWGKKKSKGFKRGRNGDEDIDDGSDGEQCSKQEQKRDSYYLTVTKVRSRLKQSRRHDLWVVGSHPLLQVAAGAAGLSRPGAPWLAVCRSLWHGPDKDGKFEIEFLSPVPQQVFKSQAVFCLKGPDVQTEIQTIELLAGTAPQAAPLLSYLTAFHGKGCLVKSALLQQQEAQQKQGAALQLGGPAKKPKGAAAGKCAAAKQAVQLADGPDVDSVVQGYVERLNLNTDQASVMRHVASWLQHHTEEEQQQQQGAASIGSATTIPSCQPPVCLIHGPFGSGKSTLLVAIVLMVTELAPKVLGPAAASAFRILVAAHTNVAVDRVLLGLKELGFDTFLRIGSLKRIAKPILCHSLHQSDDSGSKQESLAVLKEMLAQAQSVEEESTLRAEITALEKGAERQRRRLLPTCPVVGATCCALLRPVLEGCRFTLLVLDECSQLIEPLSLVPVIRAGASFIVAAGDPYQLPPVIADPPHISPGEHGNGGRAVLQRQHVSTSTALVSGGQHGAQPPQQQGLLRPMFVRLSQLGFTVHLLSHQYRCHPDLSSIPNRFFYQGRLSDGCSVPQRSSLLGPSVPALLFCSNGGQCTQAAHSRSSYNMQEAQLVAQLVNHLLQGRGLPASDVGVICFYRAQVTAISQVLAEAQSAQAPAGSVSAQLAGSSASATTAVRGTGGPPSDEGGPGAGNAGQEPGAGRRVRLQQATVQVATVDSFQGAEKEVVILATTTNRATDFLADAHRLNVALTRAKRHLIIIGAAAALRQTSSVFGALISACEQRSTSYFHSGGSMLASLAAQPSVSRRGTDSEKGEEEKEGQQEEEVAGTEDVDDEQEAGQVPGHATGCSMEVQPGHTGSLQHQLQAQHWPPQGHQAHQHQQEQPDPTHVHLHQQCQEQTLGEWQQQEQQHLHTERAQQRFFQLQPQQQQPDPGASQWQRLQHMPQEPHLQPRQLESWQRMQDDEEGQSLKMQQGQPGAQWHKQQQPCLPRSGAVAVGDDESEDDFCENDGLPSFALV